MWILEDRFSQEWNCTPQSFFKVRRNSEGKGEQDQIEMYDRRVEDYYGVEAPAYGYIIIECLADHKDNELLHILCDTGEVMEQAYDRICESIILHPSVIDFRGLNLDIE